MVCSAHLRREKYPNPGLKGRVGGWGDVPYGPTWRKGIKKPHQKLYNTPNKWLTRRRMDVGCWFQTAPILTLTDKFCSVPKPIGWTVELTAATCLDVTMVTCINNTVVPMGYHVGIVRNRLITWYWKKEDIFFKNIGSGREPFR